MGIKKLKRPRNAKNHFTGYDYVSNRYRPSVPDGGEFPVNYIVIHSNFIPEYVIIDSGDHFTY